jgi:hypothetical protein
MVECPKCGEEYKHLGQHWHHSPSHRPELTEKQLEVTTGFLMGDASVISDRKNCYLRSNMTTPKYLKYVDNLFGCLGTGVKFYKTGSEIAEMNRKSGFSPNADEEKYSDVYFWQTRLHPKFNEFREWYSSGRKVWPENIELTPTVLKHWYVGDGHYHTFGNDNSIRITMNNEVENTGKVSQYFTNAGLPEPSNYNISDNGSDKKKCVVSWGIEESYKLWEYMGEPLPDFGYKWPEEYR